MPCEAGTSVAQIAAVVCGVMDAALFGVWSGHGGGVPALPGDTPFVLGPQDLMRSVVHH